VHVIIANDFAEITGGTDKVALDEAAGFAARGHRVTLIAGQGRPSPELLAAGVDVRLTDQSAIIDDPSRLRAATQGIWNMTSAALVADVAATADPNAAVIHIHGFSKVLSSSAVRAAVRSGLPTVATLHDYFAACPNGGFYNYQRDHVCHLVPLSARCVATNCDARAYSHKVWRVSRAVVQRSVGQMPRGVRELIAPSHFAADVLRPFLPASARLRVLSNPIPIARREPVDVSSNRPFVFVGRMTRDKDPRTFARAAMIAGVETVFVGEGEDRESIGRLNPEAELTGWLDPERVLERVRGARALVCPSSWYEVQPLVPLEAAAQGVPAIVSDAGAFREAVADERTGLWFRSGDADDLAAKLGRLDAEPELAAQFGRTAYERFWSEDWSLETHLDRLESVYRDARSS
jgi:glycosyltransferase involved in cell wall biosynthesis